MEGAQACPSVIGLAHVEAGAFEQLDDQASDVVVIIDDENAGSLVHTAFIPGCTRVCYRIRRD